MLLKVNTYSNFAIEGLFRANKVNYGVHESISTLLKQILAQMNKFFLLMKQQKVQYLQSTVFPKYWLNGYVKAFLDKHLLIWRQI